MMYTTVEHHLDSTDWIAAPPPPKHYQSESQDKGVKYDQGKPKMDLIPPNALLAVGAVFEFGAKKYAERNWEKGLTSGQLQGAALRHIIQWGSGQDLDEESKLNHLAHACCCLLMLIELSQCANFVDTRTKLRITHDNANR